MKKRYLILAIVLVLVSSTVILCSCSFLNNIAYSILAQEFTITFESNGGSEIASVNRYNNAAVGELPSPTKADATFEGWFTDEELTNPFSIDTILIKDITLYAKWKSDTITYTINFVTNGGVAISPVVFTEEEISGGSISVPVATWQDGTKEFVGWFLDAELTMPVVSVSSLEEVTTFYAKWQDIEEEERMVVTIDLNYEGAAEPTAYTMRKGKTFTGNTPTRQGYTFLGWYFDAQGTQPVANGAVLNDSCTIYAKWQIITTAFSVLNRAPKGGTVTGTEDGTYDYGSSISVTAIAQEGCTFIGWFNGEELVSQETEFVFVIFSTDICLDARFEGNAVLTYDKSTQTDLDFNSELYILNVFGSGITSSNYTVSNKKLTINSAFMQALPSGKYNFLLYDGSTNRDGNEHFETITVKVTNTAAQPHDIVLNYDRAYPNVKVDFLCDCGGDHFVSIDAGAAAKYTDQNFTVDKMTAHSVKVTCAGGNNQTLNVPAVAGSHSDYIAESFMVNGNTYDKYVTTQEEFNAVLQYLLLENPTYSTEQEAFATSMEFAYAGKFAEIVAANTQNLSKAILSPAQDAVDFFMSYSTGLSYLASKQEMTLTVTMKLQPYAIYSSGFEKKSKSDDRDLLVENETPLSTLPIDNYTKTQVVNNISGLDVLPYGVRPTFTSNSQSIHAREIYETAKEICATYIPADATAFEKVRIIYDWIGVNVTYDDNVYNLNDVLINVIANKDSGVDTIRNVVRNTVAEIYGKYDSTIPVYQVFENCCAKTTATDIITTIVAEMHRFKAFHMEGVLVDNVAVCDGIASAVKLMCNIVGVECVEVSGYAEGNHAWNKVRIGNDWYTVDATWGIGYSVNSQTSAVASYVNHGFLMVTDEKLIFQGRRERDDDDNDYIANLSIGEYNYYANTEIAEGVDLDINTDAELRSVVEYYYNGGKTVIEFNYSGDYDTLCDTLYNNGILNSLHITEATLFPKADRATVYILILE